MIFTKRNALIGFATLKVLERFRARRRRKQRQALRAVGLAALVVASVGLLVGAATAAARRRKATPAETHAVGTAQQAGAEPATPGNGRPSPAEPAPAA